ncbi:hypothetical protein [Streptomyces phaeoluteigriseus]|uniref:hypothetical protein n=1 Tax=Streptomyces phaeoluteigriseus TaxID=114686 RepID=UPI003679B6E7
MTAPVHDHGPGERCEAAPDLTRAPCGPATPPHGRPPHRRVTGAPAGLLPVPPAVALPRLLRAVAEDIAARRRRETRLAEAFVPLPALAAPDGDASGTGEIHVLSGPDRINSVITRTRAEA